MRNMLKRTVLLLVAALFAAAALMAGCADDAQSAASPHVATGAASQMDTERTPDRAKNAAGESWAVYWYLCGSDLETRFGAATRDIAEMLDVSLPPNVQVVIQAGGSADWANEMFDESAMYRLTYQGEALDIVETIEPTSMGDPNTLSGFLEFCEENYPADRKFLILWDHGGGSGGGICSDELFDRDHLSLTELSDALALVYGDGDRPFDLIGFDACLMATIDVAAVCAEFANYMVASEETEPGCGWLYSGWLAELADNPGMSAAELGVAVCDSYQRGCEAIDQAEDITLSVVDLAHIGEVVAALDALSAEGVRTALDGNPTAFFADYGRGASKADYYYDGTPEMVDLVSLVDENRHLFPETADELIGSVQKSVVYQIAGPYRANSNGLSAYFPYQMDQEQYDTFSSAAASSAMAYMYELLLTGEVSQEALHYFSALEDFEESQLEDGYEFEDVTAYELDGHPVEIIEEDGITYAQLNIGPDAADALKLVTFLLAFYSDDEEIVLLGEEYDLSSDWQEGIFTDNFRGVWGAIDGHLVMMTVTSVTEEYILYSVPLLLNGVWCDLSVAYVFDEGAYRLLTATPEGGGSGVAPKEQYRLTPGDEVTTLLYYLGDAQGGEGYYENDTFTVSADTSFDEIDLPDGQYIFLFNMTDYRNDAYTSDIVGAYISQGLVEMQDLQ